MRRGLFAGACFSFALLARTHAQQVEIPRDPPRQIVARPAFSEVDEEEGTAINSLKRPPRQKQLVAAKVTLDQMRKAGALAREKVERETRSESSHFAEPPKPVVKRSEATVRTSVERGSYAQDSAWSQPVNLQMESAFTKLADGFDFPVGKPDAQGYYKARGYRSGGHLGEDWDGVRGGDSDLGDPIYSIGDGVVVFARDCHMGWGNVVIVRHAYRENGTVKNIDSLYGHLNTILVRRGQAVSRGQKIATMGTAHGLYDAHLHFEVRKNLAIGMSRAAFARDSSNYHDPTQFVLSHRHLQTGSGTYRIAMNTFTRDALIHWDRERNFSHARTGGGSSESAAALKKAVASQH
jgi:murein DD-endopeptidase MepM/ murein hydrolase activator NlpD